MQLAFFTILWSLAAVAAAWLAAYFAAGIPGDGSTAAYFTGAAPPAVITGLIAVASFVAFGLFTGLGNEKRRRMELHLKRSEERYRELVERSQEPIVVLGEGQVLYANPEAIRKLGYPREQVIGRPIADLIAPADLPVVSERHRQRLNGEVVPETYEFRIRRHDGSLYWVEITAKLCEYEGRPAIQASLHDIEARKRAELENAELKERFSKAFDGNPNPMAISLLKDGGFLDVNPSFAETFGFERDDVIGKTTVEIGLIGLETRARMIELLRRDGRFKNIETRMYRSNGDPLDVLWSAEMMTMAGEQYLLSVAVDISDRKRATNALRQSEEQFRMLTTISPDTIAILDPHGVIQYVNHVDLDLDVNSVIGVPATELMQPEYREAHQRLLAEAMADNSPRQMDIVDMFNRTLSIRLIPIQLEGEQSGIMAVLTDITLRQRFEDEQQRLNLELTTINRELRRAHDELKESQETSLALLNAPPDPALLFDAAGRFIAFNEAMLNMLQATPGQLAGKCAYDVLPQPLADQLRPQMEAVLKTYRALNDEVEIGGRCFEYRLYPVPGSKGTSARVAFLGQDVTQRRQAEQALSESEARFKALFDNSLEMIYTVDFTGKLLEANDRALEVLGYTRDELAALSIADLIDAADHDVAFARMAYCCEHGADPDIHEFKLRRKDGSYVWVEETGVLLPDYGGQSAIMGLARDITQRKQAEDALRASEELSRAVISNSPVGISVRSATGQLLTYNEAWQRIWLLSDEALKADLQRPRSKLEFNDRDDYLGEWAERIRRVYEEGGSLLIPEIRTPGKLTGVSRWISQLFYAIKDEADRVQRMVILTEDITDRKLAEEEQLKLIEDLQDALAEIKKLSGLLPICASCKKIRDDRGYWNQIEGYISEHSDARFSHGICPDCAQKMYAEMGLDPDGGDLTGEDNK